MEELGLVQILPIKVYEDNTATIAMSNNPIINKKSKHIELCYHFFKYYVQKKVVQLFYVSSINQEADILTKIVLSMDLFYSLVKKVFNIPTITTHTNHNNKTLMIKSTIIVQDRSDRMRTIHEHLMIKNHSNLFLNSEEYTRVERSVIEQRETFLKDWNNNCPFSLNEIRMFADIIEYHLVEQSKTYPSFFPKVTRGFINTTTKKTDGLVHMQKFHRYVEQHILSINRMRKLCEMFRDEPNYSEMLIRESEIHLLIESKVISKCNMNRTFVNYDDEGEEEMWLHNDETHQLALSRIDNYNLPEDQKNTLRVKQREISLKRKLKEQPTNNATISSTPNKISLDKYKKDDISYQQTLKALNDLSQMSNDEKARVVQIADTDVLKRYNDNSKLVQQAHSSRLPEQDIYNIIFKDANERQQQKQSSSNETSAIENNVKMFNEHLTQKERHSSSSSQPKHQPQSLHHLVRNNNPTSHYAKTHNTQQQFIEPINTKLHVYHKRWTRFEDTEFRHLTHRYYKDVFDEVVGMMKLTHKLIDDESISPKQKLNEHESSDENDDENDDDDDKDEENKEEEQKQNIDPIVPIIIDTNNNNNNDNPIANNSNNDNDNNQIAINNNNNNNVNDNEPNINEVLQIIIANDQPKNCKNKRQKRN